MRRELAAKLAQGTSAEVVVHVLIMPGKGGIRPVTEAEMMVIGSRGLRASSAACSGRSPTA